MNYGPLEFAVYLQRKNMGRVESATVKAAREAAPHAPMSARPENNRLTVISGGPLRPAFARAVQARPVRVFEAVAICPPIGLQTRRPIEILVRESHSPVVLVLSSHRVVRWQIEFMPGASLEAVLLAGYGKSAVNGTGDALVASIGGFYAFKQGSVEFRHLEREVMRCTGRKIEKYQCVYAGNRFDVG